MKPDSKSIHVALISGTLLVLEACSATGRPYSVGGEQVEPIPPSASRVVLLRRGDTVQYSLRRAAIAINGEKRGSLARNGYLLFDLPPGPTEISASMWDMPGSCTLGLELAPGSTTYLKVAPRPESLGAASAGAVAGHVLSGGHPAGEAAGMLAGGAIEAGKSDCGGAFGLLAIDPDAAAMQLVGLKESL